MRRRVLIAYMAAGYPPFKEQEKLIEVLEKSGVNILELGIPFSDPIADGPTIQFASQQALKRGVSLKKILIWVKSFRKKSQLPIVFMSYMNPLYQYGLKSFAKDASQAGVNGLIIPDAIPEETIQTRKILAQEGIDLIYLVTPTTPLSRIKDISLKTRGFLYAVSVTGVTGARRNFSEDTIRWLKKAKTVSSKPVCVGFGISRREHIRRLKRTMDGFIVGSALIDLIRKNPRNKRIPVVRRFIKGLAKECEL